MTDYSDTTPCPACGSFQADENSCGERRCKNCGMELPARSPGEARKRLPAWVITAAFAVLFAFLALIAWGLNRTQAEPIGLGDEVPAFTLTTFDGEKIFTRDLAGKVIVVNFWASWCKPCEQEAAEMEQAWQQYKDGGKVAFLGVAYVDTEPESRKYLERFSVTYPNAPDLRSKISQLFRTRGVPETYIIGKDGRLKQIKIGPFASLQEVTAMIDKWVNE